MPFSTKGRYAVRALLDLAMFYDRGPVNLHSIAERQEVSSDYLEQILRKLRDAGLVRSVRGPRGGFLLAKRPEDITVYEIVSALEEATAPSPCVPTDRPPKKDCARKPHCAAHLMWCDLAKHMETFLRARSLRNLCDEARKLCIQATPKHKHMFHI